MATSSITKSWVVSGRKQIKKFTLALEESYQESLTREYKKNPNFELKSGKESADEFWELMGKKDAE